MKIVIKIFMLLLISTLTYSQSLSGYKVCIDPGHGGHDPANDRHVIIPDFWESEGNYGKALHVEEILTSLGAEVFVTRDGNSDSDDLALSVRAGIANSNNVDFFHSIHSNATGISTRRNFPLMLYRGYNNAPVYPEAKEYAIKAFRNFEETNYVTDLSWDNVRGDWDFYDWGYQVGLGVLSPLTMPGVLSEGSFHDYIPEAWRLKNSSYLRHEAWAIARTMLEYFNGGNLQTGIIAGVLRDPDENVPSSYQPLSGTNDNKKPLNQIKITIEPGGVVYNGDDQNNGYYFFEDLAPGQYKVYMEAEDYTKDSATVTVTAHNSVFADKFMNLIPNPNVPNVVGNYPETGSTEVSNLANIEIDFDIRMDESSAESAFSLMPSVAGEFSWENNHKKLIFNPSNPLSPGGSYTVNINGSAKTYFEVPLGTAHAFSFSTRSKLNMVSNYPDDNSTDISQTVQVRIQFDAPINSSTLPGNILFLDESGTFVQLAVDQNAYSKGWIIFEPTKSLELNSNYRLILKEGVGDNEGVTFQEEVEINFRTVNSVYEGGNIIENFETIGDWDNPSNDPGSSGIDINATTFEISTIKKISGENSGYLAYTFTQDNARVKLSNSNPKSIGTDPNSQFGVWIFGDLSGNLLELWFMDEQSNKVGLGYGNIDWTGWKMIDINLSDISLNGSDIKFEGILIAYEPFSGDSVGSIFIDDAQHDFTTPVENEIEVLPKEYVLDQNYPNPFNPSTIINFNLPEAVNVKMEIFNIIGEKVVTLILDQEYKAGRHSVQWNGKNQNGNQVPSGIYLYKFQSNNFSAVKKMMLLK